MSTEEKMTIEERYKYLRMMKKRYERANRQEKGNILNEMEVFTGQHRKGLIRSMNGSPERQPRAKTFLHCCGSIYWALPDIIDSGIDIINPVQVSAKDMETNRLKREFGRDLVFWGGGADATEVMTNSTPDEVKEEAKKRIHDLAPGGGFVFAPVHNIQANVPPANIVARSRPPMSTVRILSAADETLIQIPPEHTCAGRNWQSGCP